MFVSSVVVRFFRVEHPDGLLIDELVVPLDGTSHSERAVSVAASIAALVGADVRLLTTELDVGDESPIAYLDRVGSTIKARIGVRTDVVGGDTPARAISGALSPSAGVCMATHAHGRVLTTLHRSVAETVVGEVPAPLFLVGPHCSLEPFVAGRVVLAHDGSPQATEVAVSLLGLIRPLAERLDVVTVVPAPMGRSTDDPYRSIREIVRPVIEAAHACGLEATHQIAFARDVHAGLLDEISTTKTSLVVMATHHRSAFDRLRDGSVTMSVVHDVAVPVLVTSRR
jgi:nucleotide-binding universal stress UspA family protein